MPFSQMILPQMIMAGVKALPLLLVTTAGLSVMSLGSCSTTPQSTSNDRYVESDATPEGELFGDYLAGTYANYVDDAQARSKHFTQAFALNTDDAGLGRKAITSAVTAGDFPLAVKLSGEVAKLETREPMAGAILGARDFEAGRYAKALDYFAVDTPDLTVSIMMKLIQAWAQEGAGDASAARITLSSLPGGSYFSRFGLLQLAELELGQGNYDAADDALKELEAQAPTQGTDSLELERIMLSARVMSANGEGAKALEFLQDYSKENGTFEIGLVPAAIKSLEAGQPLKTDYSPQEAAARALTESAYGFFGQNRAWDVAEVFLRLAVEFDPSNEKSRVWLGDILAFNKRNDEALALFRSVDESSPHYTSAKISEGYLHFRSDEDDLALQVFKDLNDKQPSFITRNALGQAYISEENYDAALPIYEALVSRLSEEELKQDPRVLFIRGVAYERTKNWDAAVADFQRVLSYKPDDSDALNYLGYTWVDRGENLTKAFDMIERALELEPNSGAITDSLGWAHYKLGDYEKAKTFLEDAVALDPDSATIIDHLGDVYYKLGRKREAGYQWQRALDYDPTDKERRDINAKLKGGLYAVKAAP